MTIEAKEILLIVLGLIVGLLFGILIGKIIRYRTLKSERELSIKKSKSIILGEVYEKVLPFLPDFPYAPRDMIFIGKGVDYIVFDGMSDGNLKKIVFLEIKSGSSRLNSNEKMIRNAILKGKVEYKEYRLGSF